MSPPPDLAAFCQANHTRIVGAVSLLCGDAAVAEELAQEAFERLARDWWRVRRMAHPEAWIYRVAINLASSHFRRRAAERRAMQRLESRTPAAQVDPDTTDELALRQAVAGLPPRQKTALVLRLYMDLTFAQVAELMGIHESTAKSLVGQALARLRNESSPGVAQEVSDVI
jgi:RNA polymerase sigma factor (sigma-70 family)